MTGLTDTKKRYTKFRVFIYAMILASVLLARIVDTGFGAAGYVLLGSCAGFILVPVGTLAFSRPPWDGE